MSPVYRCRPGKKGTGGRLLAASFLAAGLALWLGPALAGQDFSGANQSDDPCFKIKQMKKAILGSADYKRTVGARDPAYLQCIPLTINLDWNLTDSIVHAYGKDWVSLKLREEYPAYLMLNYGWFDKLQKKELQRFEILGPEPCWPPCPGRAKAELDLNGQAYICMDYYQNCKPKVVELNSLGYDVSPADTDGQHAYFRIQWEGGQTAGRICSSDMKAGQGMKPKGPGIVAVVGHFWDQDQYQLEINGSGINAHFLHDLSLKGDWPPEEIFEGLRTGSLTKVLTVQATEPPVVPGAPVYSLQGTVTVKIAFGPVKEERWRVTVKAVEKDDRKPEFIYKDIKGQSAKSPMRVDFETLLEGEFIVRKVKEDWTYKEGRVTKAENAIKLTHYLSPELYQCSAQQCPGGQGIPDMLDNFIQGTLQDKKVKLAWAEASTPRTRACVLCTPKKSYLSKVPYRQEFGSGELVYNLNKEILPLQDGLTVNRQVGDFLRYAITLKKVQ